MLLSIFETQPADIWHDPLFLTILGIAATLLAGIIGAIVAYWIYRRQRSKKEITYQVISDAPIANINKEVKDRVKILFDGNPVEDINLLVLKVWNPGRVAVKRDDFDEPITFEFGERKVVASDILSMEPANLIDTKDIKTFFTLGSESVELQKFLLNPKEEISLKVLLTGPPYKVSGRARIVDGKITEFNPNNQPVIIRYRTAITFSVVALTILVASFVLASISSTSSGSTHQTSLFLFLLPLFAILGLVASLLAIYEFIARVHS